MQIFPLHLIDWYKVDHRRQYPEGTAKVFVNFTPRKSRIPAINHVVFFGLQYFIKEYLIDQWNRNFFNIPLHQVLNTYRRRIDTALGPNTITLDHITALWNLGYLPIEILAVPEGVSIPIKVPPFVAFSTREEGFWLPNYLETIFSASLWQACNSATLAKEYKRIFDKYALATVGDINSTPWQGHDFSFRGMSSLETACLSGAGHLLSFYGTDTVPAIDFLEEYYGADADQEIIGQSVPATEHSVMCMGSKEAEIETFQRLLNLYPSGFLSVVSDTWDYWKVLTEYLPQLKEQIMGRDGRLVIRPDSSPKTPYEIIVGDKDAAVGTPEYKGSVELMWEIFGGVITPKGYKVLDSHIGLIYGDSITLELAEKINSGLMAKGFASVNWVAGIGSFTYQYNTRDTFGWAMKATYGEVNGEPREIFKDPKTDSGMKKSAKGLIAVYKNSEGEYYMKDRASWQEVLNCELKPVYRDGKLLVDQTLSEIRNRML